MSLKNKIVVVIGGSSGIGLATAKAAVKEGAHVIIAGRSEEKLRKAKSDIGGDVETYPIDATQEEKVKNLFDQIGQFDHLVTTAAVQAGSIGASGPFLVIDSTTGRSFFDSKFWGQYYVAKHGALKIKDGGSITLTSGLLSERPMPGLANVSAVNGAINALGRALAVELAPRIRVNVVSPGLVLTPIFRAIPEKDFKKFTDSIISRVLMKRGAEPDEVAQTYVYLMKNAFTTGTVIDIDGGHRLA